MVNVNVLLGIGEMLLRARRLNGGKVLEKKDRDGTVWVYRWEDTVEAEMLHTVGELLRPIVEAQGGRQKDLGLVAEDRRVTVSDAKEVEHWLLYRARSWQHGQDLKNRRRKRHAGSSL